MEIKSIETKFTKCSSIEIPESFYNRMTTGCPEIDHMFGTEYLPGFMAGSTISICGVGGSGKSTGLAQISEMLCNNGKRAAIASGEESHLQLAYACKRLNIDNVDIAHCKNVEDIADAMHFYDFMVVDSFQALRTNRNMKKKEFYQYAQDLLITTAKETGCVLVFVLHITTTGLPKGGTDIIHAVDVNVKVTVDKNDESMRIFHVYKNRFGETKMHCATMGSHGLDFKGVRQTMLEEKEEHRPVTEIRKEEILNSDEESLTLPQVCGMFGVSNQIAGNLLRDLVSEGKIQKIGRGIHAVWKIVEDCKKIHNILTK